MSPSNQEPLTTQRSQLIPRKSVPHHQTSKNLLDIGSRFPHEKPIRVVIRGLHPQATPDSTRAELQELDYSVISIYRLGATSLMTVNLKRCEEAKRIYKARALFGVPTKPPITTEASPSTSTAPSHTTNTSNRTRAQTKPPRRTETQQAAVSSKASSKVAYQTTSTRPRTIPCRVSSTT
ncbi:hypothetical protein CBL_08589 [Carabus blaptoides fortunei]